MLLKPLPYSLLKSSVYKERGILKSHVLNISGSILYVPYSYLFLMKCLNVDLFPFEKPEIN